MAKKPQKKVEKPLFVDHLLEQDWEYRMPVTIRYELSHKENEVSLHQIIEPKDKARLQGEMVTTIGLMRVEKNADQS